MSPYSRRRAATASSVQSESFTRERLALRAAAHPPADGGDSGPGAEDAVPDRRQRPRARREVAEAHAPAEALALPLEVRQLVGKLPNDDGPVADGPLDLPRTVGAQVVDENRDRRHVRV